MKLLQVSDLHLSCRSDESRRYGLSVLDEIFETAADEAVDALIVAGDLFDSFPDLVALKDEWVRRVDAADFTCVFLMGNHEVLKQPPSRSIDGIDWGKTVLMTASPLVRKLISSRNQSEKLDLIGIPHQEDLSGLPEALAQLSPVTDAQYRWVVAHGSVIGWSYIGVDDELGGCVFDPKWFADLSPKPDWVALGHIHRKPPVFDRYGFPMAYAGSSRVWRKGEQGRRGGWLINHTEQGTRPRFVEWKSAGQFKEVEWVFGATKEERHWPELESEDWVQVTLAGVVESEKTLKERESELRNRLAKQVRKVTFDREGVVVLEEQTHHPVLVEFLERVEEAPAQLRSEVRQIGVREILRSLNEVNS